MFLLHAHDHGAGEGILAFLEEVVLHALKETFVLVPFLFLTYLLMEFIEHKSSSQAERFMKRAGIFGPLVGGLLGAVPQCGFSAAAANLYTGGVISVGTLVAVFLSTSDEMIAILVGGEGAIPPTTVALLVLYKALVGIICGFVIDLIVKLTRREKKEISIDEICENDECHCEKGIFHSAIHHTLTISLFVLVTVLIINALVFFVGTDALGAVMYDKPFVSHLIAGVVGLIPSCAPSVLLATLYSKGIITVGTMLSGLFSGAGVGLLVLFKVNRHHKENLFIAGILVLIGVIFGLVGELLFAL